MFSRFDPVLKHCLFEPLDFLARLAALLPRLRRYLMRYRGVFAPTVAYKPTGRASRAAMTLMQRLRRVYGKEVSVCLGCGGALKVLAVTSGPQVIILLLAHLAKRQTRAPADTA